MLNNLVGTFKEDTMNLIIDDAMAWLIEKFGENSIELNKANYKRKHSALKSYIFKHKLTYSWSYNPRSLDWHYYGQFAEYNADHNTIYLHCNKKFTLAFVLDCLFHEYRHTQQSMFGYHFHRVSYYVHPYEYDANTFATEWVPIFWESYDKELLA